MIEICSIIKLEMLDHCFWPIITVRFVDLCLAQWWVMSTAAIIHNDVEPSGRSRSFCIRRSTLLTASTCVKSLPRPLPADFLLCPPARVPAVAFSDGPPTTTAAAAAASAIFEVRWGWAAGVRVEVGLWQTEERSRRWWRGGSLWKDLWQPVNITGPPNSQHLICCLH